MRWQARNLDSDLIFFDRHNQACHTLCRKGSSSEKMEGEATMTRFTDKIVLITGAGRGIGRAMALRFAQEGAQIVAADIEPALAESTAAAVKEMGRQCLPLKVDVTKPADIQGMIAQTINQFNRV